MQCSGPVCPVRFPLSTGRFQDLIWLPRPPAHGKPFTLSCLLGQLRVLPPAPPPPGGLRASRVPSAGLRVDTQTGLSSEKQCGMGLALTSHGRARVPATVPFLKSRGPRGQLGPSAPFCRAVLASTLPTGGGLWASGDQTALRFRIGRHVQVQDTDEKTSAPLPR